MTKQYPYRFNVAALEVEDVSAYLRNVPRTRWRISTIEMVDGLEIDEWRALKALEAKADAISSGDDHRIVDPIERAALLETDTDAKVEIIVQGMPSAIARRLLNRIAIHGGVNENGITRENWSSAFRRGLAGYLVHFADKNDAILFKLAMWKRPGEDARP
ncbi:hypothetical protein MOP88_07385 [Sphingomonas sp. WKB10]|nr:hypothetical protein [Sphingomonas sp. WKB10]